RGILKNPLANLYTKSAFEAENPTIRCFACRIAHLAPGRRCGSNGSMDCFDFDVALFGFVSGKQPGNPNKCGTSALLTYRTTHRRQDARADSRNSNLSRAGCGTVRSG